MSGKLTESFCGRRYLWKQTAHARVEPLESRRLLSASLSGAFTVALPTTLLPEEKSFVNVRVSNTGDARSTGTVKMDLFASKTPGFDAASVLLADASRTLHLKPRAGANFHLWLSPSPTLPDGNYYLVVKMDAAANTGATVASAIIPTQRTIGFRHPFVKLTGRIVSQPARSLITVGSRPAGKTGVLVFNQGSDPARGPLSIIFYASSDQILDANDPMVATIQARNANIQAGNSRLFSANVILPPGMAAGNYRLFAVISAGGLNGGNPPITLSAVPLVVADAPPVIDLRQPHHHNNDQDSDAPGDDDSTDSGSDGAGFDTGGTISDFLPVTDNSAGDTPAPDGRGGNGGTIDSAPPDSTPPDATPPDSAPPDSAPPDPSSSGDPSGSGSSSGGDFTQDPTGNSGGGASF